MRRGYAGAFLCATVAAASPAQATVLFQNTGTTAGWDSQITQHIGKITEVAAPAYRSSTSLRMEQTFQGFDGYHSEVRKHDIGHPGEDLYYGEALQLPGNWIFHDQNVTFEQFAQTDVFGSPWVLMFVQNDHLFVAHVVDGRGTTDLGSIAGLQGTWIRIVTRMKLGPSGLYELWVNGMKRASLTGNIQAPNKGAIRWSVGMYCTYWRRENPKGLDPMVLFHDQMRVATTYDEADPANWGSGGEPTTADGGPDAEAPRPADAGEPADAEPATPEAGPTEGGAGGAGGNSPRRPDAGATGGGGGGARDPEDPGSSAVKPRTGHAGSCALASPGGDSGPAAIFLLLVGSALLRRRPRG